MDENSFLDRLIQIIEEPNTECSYCDLCDLYCVSTPQQREFIRSSWSFNRKWKIPCDTTLALNIDREIPREKRLRAALIYHSIENVRVDYRDNLMSICLLYHSTVLLGLNPVLLFTEVAKMSTVEVSNLILGFLNRKAEDKSLEAFSFQEVNTPNGVEFKYIP